MLPIRNYICNYFLITMATVILLSPLTAIAQKNNTDTLKIQSPEVITPAAKPTYPKVVSYLSFILPLYTFSTHTTGNFNGTTRIGFPVGINILYSDSFGFSYELTPTITGGKGTSKMSNLQFAPGTMFRFHHGFTFISRLAFETSGRYGFTPVFNKVYLRTKFVNYFVAASTPVRFGNTDPASIGLSLQLGFIFN
jgi:hypothetical protein